MGRSHNGTRAAGVGGPVGRRTAMTGYAAGAEDAAGTETGDMLGGDPVRLTGVGDSVAAADSATAMNPVGQVNQVDQVDPVKWVKPADFAPSAGPLIDVDPLEDTFPGYPAEPTIVTVCIPADPDYVPLLRAACGQLAPRLHCTPSEVTDLRLAVDEACGLLLRNGVRLTSGTDRDNLTAVFTVDGPVLHLDLRMEADAFAAPSDDEFGWTILTALVDSFTWRADGTTVRVEIMKKHAARR